MTVYTAWVLFWKWTGEMAFNNTCQIGSPRWFFWEEKDILPSCMLLNQAEPTAVPPPSPHHFHTFSQVLKLWAMRQRGEREWSRQRCSPLRDECSCFTWPSLRRSPPSSTAPTNLQLTSWWLASRLPGTCRCPSVHCGWGRPYSWPWRRWTIIPPYWGTTAWTLSSWTQSVTPKSPWEDSFTRCGKKTCLRSLVQRVPKKPRYESCLVICCLCSCIRIGIPLVLARLSFI